MDLNRINIKPRIRNTWEAIDLGFIMARSWWRILFLSWLIPATLVYIPLSLVFYDDNWLALLITWWLKPLFDRAPLFIASRRLFSEDVTIGETLRKLPGLYATDLFPWLLWRRLSLTRSFDMPITVLESLKHTQRNKRLHTLHQTSSNAATWLTIVCVHLELVIWLGTLGFFMLLIPEEININLMDMIIDEDMIGQLVSNSVQFMAMALIAPFYTMAGFALYINRRIALEAWDLEIRFRHLAETRQKRNAPAVLSILLALFMALSFTPQNVHAAEKTVLTPEQSKTLIGDVLDGADFHDRVTRTGWRLRDLEAEQETDGEGIPDWLIELIRFLEDMFGDSETEDASQDSGINLAALLEVLLWAGIISIVLYVIYRVMQFYEVLAPSRKSVVDLDTSPPDILFGLDVRKDSIPEDVAGQTLSLWNSGKHREAIGLLYRSTLSMLIHRFSYRFFDGHTEQECARIVKHSAVPALSDFVFRVTDNWQQIAYAHRTPPEQNIRALCAQWDEVTADEK